MESCPDVGLQESYSNPLCPPTMGTCNGVFSLLCPSCPSPSPFPAEFHGWELGQERGETNPPRAPGEISLVKPKLLKLSSSFCFLWGRSWPK